MKLYERFNTSHVTLYQQSKLVWRQVTCFNTSHVTLYLDEAKKEAKEVLFQYISCYSLSLREIQNTRSTIVSIHLMLLFIRASTVRGWKYILVSIHLMLLFIRVTFGGYHEKYWFQYISCYSLSRHSSRHSWSCSLFQYISCYSLSAKNRPVSNYSCMFQYISCYSLSIFYFLITSYLASFNTSHVTLYPPENWWSQDLDRRFNTSHVTLYQEVLQKMSFRGSCFNTSHVTLYHDTGIHCCT